MVKELGAKVYSYTCDLSQRNKVYDAADKVKLTLHFTYVQYNWLHNPMNGDIGLYICVLQVKREVGDVDILVNNAGIVTGRNFLDCPDQLIEKTMEVNINAHFWVRQPIFV